MKTLQGDLVNLALSGHFDVLIHGCNCFCVMGAGLALQIKEAFPSAFLADKATKKGDRYKLGTYTKAVERPHGTSVTIINAYTQFHYGRDRDTVYTDYAAIERVFQSLAIDLPVDARIGIPLIGAGLAKGHWPTIQAIIDRTMVNHDLTLVEFRKN